MKHTPNPLWRFITHLDRKSDAGLGFESFAAAAVLVLGLLAACTATAAAMLYGIVGIVTVLVWAGSLTRYLALVVVFCALAAFVRLGVRK